MIREIFERVLVIITNMIYGNSYLFDGDDAVFKKALKKVDYYGEYGMGKSSIWVANNTQVINIFSVDTSEVWVEKVRNNVKPVNKLIADWVDVGRVVKWGKPVDYSKRENILNYVKSIWRHEQKPQLVLVDGRFRVACFLYSLATGMPGTKIIFDDYTNRPHYHLVEEFIKPVESCGRQCMFVIPEGLDKEKIMNLMRNFLFVMD